MKEQYLSGKEIVLLEVRKNKENLNFEIVCMWEREWEREREFNSVRCLLQDMM